MTLTRCWQTIRRGLVSLGPRQNMHLARRWHFMSNIPMLCWMFLAACCEIFCCYLPGMMIDIRTATSRPRHCSSCVVWWLSTSLKVLNWRPVFHNMPDLITFLLPLKPPSKFPKEVSSMKLNDWVVIILPGYRPASVTSENNFRCQQIIDFIVLARNT